MAVQPAEVESTFARLMGAAEASPLARSLLVELRTATADDSGNERAQLRPDTFMADALVVAIAARPRSALDTMEVLRRLALVKVPEVATGA